MVRRIAKHGRHAIRANEIRGLATGMVIAKCTAAVTKEQYVDALF
jgi:hypothetical protein